VDKIQFPAEIVKVSTLKNNDFRVTLDFPGVAVAQFAHLGAYRGYMANIIVEIVEQEADRGL
jgi:hypothetical protein